MHYCAYLAACLLAKHAGHLFTMSGVVEQQINGKDLHLQTNCSWEQIKATTDMAGTYAKVNTVGAVIPARNQLAACPHT